MVVEGRGGRSYFALHFCDNHNVPACEGAFVRRSVCSSARRRPKAMSAHVWQLQRRRQGEHHTSATRRLSAAAPAAAGPNGLVDIAATEARQAAPGGGILNEVSRRARKL